MFSSRRFDLGALYETSEIVIAVDIICILTVAFRQPLNLLFTFLSNPWHRLISYRQLCVPKVPLRLKKIRNTGLFTEINNIH